MAYRAEIEIGVKGVRSLEQLRSEINKSATAAESLNAVVGARGGLVQNIQNYANNLEKISRSLRLVTAGTAAETKAVQEYVTALGQANAARARQNGLIDAEIKKRTETARIQKLTAAGIYETTRFKQPIGPQPSLLQGQSSFVGERIARALAQRKDEAALQQALLKLEQRKATELNQQLETRGKLNAELAREVNLLRNGITATTQYQQAIGPVPAPATRTGQTGRGIGSRFGGAISGAVIGGAFPLLFGQTGGAAAGGAIGGLVGSLLGPGGSFAGSLLGTLLGEVASKGQQVKDLAADIGFSADQTKRLQEAFALAGRDSDKFISSVQNIRGLSLSLQDQADTITVVSNLTEEYGGKIDKVTTAFANALESGKVTQATLNQLGNEGIPIQETLAKKYNVGRSALLQMAKDGKISVQDLTDSLVELSNKATGAATKTVNGWEATWKNIQRGASLSLQATVAVFNAIASAGIKSSGNILADFSAMYVALVKGAISMGVRVTSIFANLARGAANLAATMELGGINITATPSKKGFKALESTFARINTNLQGINIAEPAPGKVGGIQAPGQLPEDAGKSKKDKSAEEAARLAAEIRAIQMQTEATKQLAYLKGNITQAEIANNKELAIRLEGELRNQQILIDYQQSLEGVTSEKKKQALLEKAQVELQASNIETAGNLERFESERTKAFAEQVASLDLQLQMRSATTEEARRQLQIEYEIQKLRREGTFTEPQLSVLQQKMLAAGAPVLGADLVRQEIGKISDEMTKLTDLGTLSIGIADSIGSAFANSFKGIISGSMSAQEALASFFQSVADYFLDMAAQIIQKWIQMTILNQILPLLPGAAGAGFTGGYFNPITGVGAAGPNFGFRAAGGPVSSGQPYVVGERGPELFVPGRSGAIVPNNQLGASTSVVVNVDAKGTSVQGNDQTGNQLARAVAAAVQAELVKQRRPGGLLTV